MRTRDGALLALAVAVLAGVAGLGLAQNAEAPQNELQNAVSPTTPFNQLDIPPPEEAPPPSAEAEAPPREAPETPPGRPAGNDTANAVAEAPPPPPPAPKRPRYPTVVLQALDKVTAETLRFEARINEPVRYKDLVITVHACETQASDEPYAQTAAHLEVQYQPEVLGGRTPQVARQVFRGWMFGDAPGLHPLEHPIYDVWVIACKTASAPAAAPVSPAPGASL